MICLFTNIPEGDESGSNHLFCYGLQSLSPLKLFPVLEFEPRDLFMLKKHPIIELHPQSNVQHFDVISI